MSGVYVLFVLLMVNHHTQQLDHVDGLDKVQCESMATALMVKSSDIDAWCKPKGKE